jgi:hypothetical protein
MKIQRMVAITILSAPSVLPAQTPDFGMTRWEALPEHTEPEWREMCSRTLSLATTITNMRAKGAKIPQLLQWAVQEAERADRELALSPEELARQRAQFGEPIGALMLMEPLLRMIRWSITGGPAYRNIPGGFVQFAYRSCLKGEPIDEELRRR